MIILPEIPIILDIDSKLTRTPTLWSLALALNCTLGNYTKEQDKKLSHLIYDDQSGNMPECRAALLMQAVTDHERIIITGKAIEKAEKPEYCYTRIVSWHGIGD